MTREKARKKFIEEHQVEREKIKEDFLVKVRRNPTQIMEPIFRAFFQAKEMLEVQEKHDNVYFQFSIQRCDLLNNDVIIRLDVMDSSWYMDKNIITVMIDFTFLFQDYFLWKEKLLLDMRSYMGKINYYDVENMVQDEIVASYFFLVHYLRFSFRKIEEQESFSLISKMPFWVIQWGEFKDCSENIIRVNRTIRSEEEWLEKLEEYRKNKKILSTEYWYSLTANEGNCQKKKMVFITFENCILNQIDFSKSDLFGARFIRCKLSHCNFCQCDMQQTEFRECVFSDNIFKEANVANAVFTQSGFPWKDFDEKQMEELLIMNTEDEERVG